MNGEFLNNLYLAGGLFVGMTTVMWMFASAIRRETRREIRRVDENVQRLDERVGRLEKTVHRESRRTKKSIRREMRRMDKRLTGEVKAANEGVWLLRMDMEVVKYRLDIDVPSHPEAAPPRAPAAVESASSEPVADLPPPIAPEIPVKDAADPAPVAVEPQSEEPAPVAEGGSGSEGVSHRLPSSGVLPSGIPVTPGSTP